MLRLRYSTVVRSDPPMPFVKVELIRDNKSVRTEGLLDSGSNTSIFHAELAEDIGINFSQGNPVSCVSASGQAFTAYQHRVHVRLGPHTIQHALIAFTRDTNSQYGLLGQDFFRFFRIRFVASQMLVEITRERRR